MPSLSVLTVVASALFSASPAPSEPFGCRLLVFDALGRPVDARGTCGGLAVSRMPDGYIGATGAIEAGASAVAVEVSAPGFLPTRATMWRGVPGGWVSGLLFLRRAGEPYSVEGGVERPFVPEPDRLIVELDRYDRAHARALSQAEAQAELAPLIARAGLVVVPPRPRAPADGRPTNTPGCGVPATVMLARADGSSFAGASVPELALLRAHPRVRHAGVLVWGGAGPDGWMAFGTSIRVTAAVPKSADPAGFARRFGATWDPKTFTLRWPDTIGLTLVDMQLALHQEMPELAGELEVMRPISCDGAGGD